jgi:hypothetical protein
MSSSIHPLSAISPDGKTDGLLQPRHRLGPLRRNRDRDLGGLMLDRIEPMGVRARLLQQPVAGAQRAFERGHATRMLGIHRQRQAVEKTSALGGGSAEHPVHRRHQPDHPDMVGHGRHRDCRLAVDPAFAPDGRVLRSGRLDPGSQCGEPERAVDVGGHRP